MVNNIKARIHRGERAGSRGWRIKLPGRCQIYEEYLTPEHRERGVQVYSLAVDLKQYQPIGAYWRYCKHCFPTKNKAVV